MSTIKKFILLLLILVSVQLSSQNILEKKEAVELALKNNYGIIIAKNNSTVAKNNASVYNSGYLPRITAIAGANYDNDNSVLTAHNGEKTTIENAESTSYNASIGLSYTLFDGLGRSYMYKRLKETHNLSELETKSIIERSLLQIFTYYYEVARLTENNKNISESLNISKQRLLRMDYGFEYGQNTKLQQLNAEVDVNKDSIRYINEQRLLANTKRDLNLLLGRAIKTEFDVDTEVNFTLFFELNTLLEKAKIHNIEMQKINKSVDLSNFDIKISRAPLFPTIQMNTSYGLNGANNDTSFNYNSQYFNGFNFGLQMNWNVFDGGHTKTRIENAKIDAENILVQKELIDHEIERKVSNAFEIYNNAIFTLKAEEKNVETNNRNFSRSEEQYRLGQITSIEFRQAQVNLFNVKSNLNQSKYDAKIAELVLLQLTGDLLNTTF